MTFRPEAIRGASRADRPAAGVVDHRLARRAVISEFRKGRLARHDVCDAHPELRRAAQQVATPTRERCPICEDDDVVLVTYAFGPRLPAHGRCITSRTEITKLERQRGPFACYVVEVCPTCSWNHLAQTYLLGSAVR